METRRIVGGKCIAIIADLAPAHRCAVEDGCGHPRSTTSASQGVRLVQQAGAFLPATSVNLGDASSVAQVKPVSGATESGNPILPVPVRRSLSQQTFKNKRSVRWFYQNCSPWFPMHGERHAGYFLQTKNSDGLALDKALPDALPHALPDA